MKTLTEQAKNIKRNYQKHKYTEEEVDLCLAFLRKEITYSSVLQVLKIGTGSFPNFIVQAIKLAYEQKRIIIK